VLTDRRRKGGRWEPAEFFATGAAEVQSFLGRAAELGLPESRGRALDFGCGVGRLTRALSAHFDEVVGVDVSEGMVRRARELNGDRPNLEFVVNAEPRLAKFETGSFDFVLSHIVLQHMPARATAAAYVRELVRVTRPGGGLVFQLPASMSPVYRLGVTRHAYVLLRALRVPAGVLLRRTPFTPMRMIFVPEADVRALLEDAGGEVRAAEPYAGDRRNLTYYVARRPASSSP
jgi:SAM-dependent methyltransferase